ncbi:MAG TPA: AAA family ATPase [Burkholderiaceae bacterium]
MAELDAKISRQLAAHHDVRIADGALIAAVKLTRRHLPGRQLPDKAISLLDTACARVAMSQHVRPSQIEDVDQALQVVNQALAWQQSDRDMGLSDASAQGLEQRRDELTQQVQAMLGELDVQRGQVRGLMKELASDGRVDRTTATHESILKSLATPSSTLWVRPWVDEQIVADVLSEWTGVPSERMATDDAQRMLDLQRDLSARIHGQEGALKQLVDVLQIARAGLNDAQRPLGVFALAGPTGTGKTETALALSDLLFGGAANLIHFNMNEFQEAHSVSTLKGAPPGYVGYGKGGRLTEAVRRRPYSVVLLDEFDQAHRDVHEIFYQAFDKGWMEDGEGRRVSFRNCLILLTTNLGAEGIEAACEADADAGTAKLSGLAHQALRDHLSPALLARMRVVAYRPLTQEAMARIVDESIVELRQCLAESDISLEVSDDVRQWAGRIAVRHPSRGRAARDLLREAAVPTIAQGVLSAQSAKRSLRQVRLSAPESLEIEFDPPLLGAEAPLSA